MSTELATLPDERIREIVKALPTNKRAAFSKALKAAVQHLRDARANYDDVFPKAALIVENWWHLGKELKRIGMGRGKYQTALGQSDRIPTCAELGINWKQSERCQKLAEMSASELVNWIQKFYDPTKWTYPTLKAGAVHVSQNTGQPEWYTPPEFISAARKVLGEIDLDPASSEKAQETVGAKKYYTINDDGLTKQWKGRVWLNPPYASDQVDQFMLKLKTHVDNGDVPAAITLTNNSTDTKWFNEASKSAKALCLVQKRVRFLDETGKPGAPLQGQAMLYFGNAVKRFATRFKDFGSLWQRLAT